jgi:hypothetical protein
MSMSATVADTTTERVLEMFKGVGLLDWRLMIAGCGFAGHA